MKIRNELKEINIKNCACCHFDDKINGTKINFSNISFNKKLHKVFKFITFHVKLQPVQIHSVLGLIKQMDLLQFLMVKLNI